MEKINLKLFTKETNLSTTGVYMITHKNSNLKYVGSTFCKHGFAGRWKAHINGWKRGIGNVILLRIYNKYGIEGFNFSIIEVVEDEHIVRDRERFWIDYYDTYNNGANVSLDTYCPIKNYKHFPLTEEQKLKYMYASPTKKKIYVYDKTGNLLYIFPSSVACDRFFGLPKRRTNWIVNHPLRSIHKEYYPTKELKKNGWNPSEEKQKLLQNKAKRIAEKRKKEGSYNMTENQKNKIRLSSNKRILVKLYTINGEFVKEFNSLNECDDFLKLTRGTTSKVLKGKARTLKRKYIPKIT